VAQLTAKARKQVKTWGLPGEKKYPMPDPSHADNALGRAKQQLDKGLTIAVKDSLPEQPVWDRWDFLGEWLKDVNAYCVRLRRALNAVVAAQGAGHAVTIPEAVRSALGFEAQTSA
jgi:hypothetical protein